LKAVILAGGEGTRLRPLTCETPKPMARLFDRPIMEYVLYRLRSAGITQAAVTLGYRPQQIEEYFGDGSEYGMHLSWYRENAPLGTAGSVAACADFLGDEDFLVISGDCITDFDLGHAIAAHRRMQAEATIVLTHHDAPTEYGLVLTGEEGRVRGFVEKPAWGQVVTDTVSTGIYVLSPRVLAGVQRGKNCDFARDLFPTLMQQGRLRAVTLDGYWCDIGDCDAFRTCAFDILDAKADWEALGFGENPALHAAGRFSGSTILAPSFIGENVTLQPGAVVGPYAVIGEGSCVGSGACVERSIVNAAVLGDGVRVYESLLCADVHIGRYSVLEGACVLGRGVRVGEDCTLRRGVRIWPDAQIPSGMQVSAGITQGTSAHALMLDERGELLVTANMDFTVTDACALGAAAAMAAGKGMVAVGSDASAEAAAMAQAARAGLLASGICTVSHDAPTASCAAWAVQAASAKLGLFFAADEEETLRITVCAEHGLPPDRAALRKLEGALHRRDAVQAPNGTLGKDQTLQGVPFLYAAAAEGNAVSLSARSRIWVAGDGESSRILRTILGRMGADVEPGAFLQWEPSKDGYSLSAVDENGEFRDDMQTLAAALLEASELRRTLVLPWTVPMRIRTLLEAQGCRICRAVTPRERRQAASMRYLWDGVYRAAFLSRRITEKKTTLAGLCAVLPRFCTYSRELPLHGSRAAFMRRLQESMAAENAGVFSGEEGLCIERPDSFVRVQACAQPGYVRITAEAMNEETAAELCDFMEMRTRKLDGSR